MKNFITNLKSRSFPIKRRFRFGFMALLIGYGFHSSHMQAADNSYLNVVEKDSTQILFPVLERPIITLDGNTVKIASESLDYSAEVDEILYFGFIDYSTSGIASVFSVEPGVEINSNTVIVKGLQDGHSVTLYSINGVTIGTHQSKDGVAKVDLSQLPHGVYILSTINANYKIRK